MDESTIEKLKEIFTSNSDLISQIASRSAFDKSRNGENTAITHEINDKNTKIQILENLLPLLDEKSKRTADYILAALKISEIIKELKNKYS